MGVDLGWKMGGTVVDCFVGVGLMVATGEVVADGG